MLDALGHTEIAHRLETIADGYSGESTNRKDYSN